mgnify:CR=1 FL=1
MNEGKGVRINGLHLPWSVVVLLFALFAHAAVVVYQVRELRADFAKLEIEIERIENKIHTIIKDMHT